jgi:hypothetical protein
MQEFDKGFEPEVWTRKSFDVRAVRITDDNIRVVALWSGGIVRRLPNNPGEALRGVNKRCIQLEVNHYNKLREVKAYVGDWILMTDEGFRHYRDKSFRLAFQPKDPRKRYEEVRALVSRAMIEQDAATYLGRSSETKGLTDEIALQIIQLFS